PGLFTTAAQETLLLPCRLWRNYLFESLPAASLRVCRPGAPLTVHVLLQSRSPGSRPAVNPPVSAPRFPAAIQTAARSSLAEAIRLAYAIRISVLSANGTYSRAAVVPRAGPKPIRSITRKGAIAHN